MCILDITQAYVSTWHHCWLVVPQVGEEANSPAPFTDLRFSNDGNLLLACVEGRVYVLDAFKGLVQVRAANAMVEPNPNQLTRPCGVFSSGLSEG